MWYWPIALWMLFASMSSGKSNRRLNNEHQQPAPRSEPPGDEWNDLEAAFAEAERGWSPERLPFQQESVLVGTEHLVPLQPNQLEQDTLSAEIARLMRAQKRAEFDALLRRFNSVRQPLGKSIQELTPDVVTALQWLMTAVHKIRETGFFDTEAFRWFVQKRADEQGLRELTDAQYVEKWLKEAQKNIDEGAKLVEKAMSGDAFGFALAAGKVFVEWVAKLNREAEYKQAIEQFYPELLEFFKVLGPPPTALLHFRAHMEIEQTQRNNLFYFEPEKVNSAGDVVLSLLQTFNEIKRQGWPIEQVYSTLGEWDVSQVSRRGAVVSFLLGGSWAEWKNQQGSEIYIEYALSSDLLSYADTKGDANGAKLQRAYLELLDEDYHHNELSWFRFDLADQREIMKRAGYRVDYPLRFTVGYDASAGKANLSKRYWQRKFHTFTNERSWLLSRPDSGVVA